ncbi:MAG TPA: hypothetical protein VLT47_03295 [Anaeromyxobacteraceae bacterium]|nr:hypothetical protein [Anaeromyxobacteraceae bacterium]
MALVPFPPTSTGFLAQCAKPEAFIGNAQTPGIATSTIDQVLRQEADRAVAVAVQDTYTPPIVQMDEGFVGAVYATTARLLMSFRGYNRQAGADEEIAEAGKRADDYFALCQQKKARPLLVDSAQLVPRDSVRISSQKTSDAWARRPGSQP